LEGRTEKYEQNTKFHRANIKNDVNISLEFTLAKAGSSYDENKYNSRLMLLARGNKLIGFMMFTNRDNVSGKFDGAVKSNKNVCDNLKTLKRPNNDWLASKKLPTTENKDIVVRAVSRGTEIKYICVNDSAKGSGKGLATLALLYSYMQDPTRPFIVDTAYEFIMANKDHLALAATDSDQAWGTALDDDDTNARPIINLLRFYGSLGFVIAGVSPDKSLSMHLLKAKVPFSNWLLDSEAYPMYRGPLADDEIIIKA